MHLGKCRWLSHVQIPLLTSLCACVPLLTTLCACGNVPEAPIQRQLPDASASSSEAKVAAIFHVVPAYPSPLSPSPASTVVQLPPPLPIDYGNDSADSRPSAAHFISHWRAHSGAVALFTVWRDASTTSPDGAIVTRVDLVPAAILVGSPPLTVVRNGGTQGTIAVLDAAEPRVRVGETYLGFFQLQPSRDRLIAAIRQDADGFHIADHPYSMSEISNIIQTANDESDMTP